jgi:hypothetical protein
MYQSNVSLLIAQYGLSNEKLNIKPEWIVNDFANEMQFQTAAIVMLSREFPRLKNKYFHPKNEGFIPKLDYETDEQYKQRKLREGQRNKTQGMRAGIMDIIIRHNGIMYEIELKQPNGSLSDVQKEIHSDFTIDCPRKPPIIAYTVVEVYLYCKKILKDNLRIQFVDYENILKKYLAHIKEIEGSSLLDGLSNIIFSEQEKKIIQSCTK